MKRISTVLLAFLFGLYGSPASAQEAAPAWQPNPEHSVVLEEIASAIGPSALENINNAEQVFCYQITNRP